MKTRKGVREESRESLSPSQFIYFLSVPTMWKPGKRLLSFNKMLHATNYDYCDIHVWAFFRIENVTELPKLQPKIPTICHFRNKKGTEAEMLPAVVFVIIAADALVSYWSLFFLSLETRSHSNGPIPFSFVKWWIELVTPRCSDYSPVSRKTGGCFPEAVTYAGPEKSPIWLSGTSRFSCWASKIFNLPCPMCKGGFRQVIWYNNHQLRQASTGPGLAIKNMWELLVLRTSCSLSFFQALIWTFEVEN